MRAYAGALWPRQIPSLVHGHFVRTSQLFGRFWQCASVHLVEHLTDEPQGVNLVVMLAGGKA